MKRVFGFGMLMLVLAVSAFTPAAHASDVNMDLITTKPPDDCEVPGSTMFLTTYWYVIFNQNYFSMKDVLPMNPIQGSNGLNNYWHCTGAYTGAIFWKDTSLGICSGTVQANLTAVASCNLNNYCTPKDPGIPFDYTVHWNNPACA